MAAGRSGAGGGSSAEGFVPGNLPALQHQDEQYVEWLESLAASVAGGGSSAEGFVPGSLNIPAP